ncbi:hypothetical protein UPYG_G00319800 [Umbra pygmaea]|uniref:Uncharacterized protein n=1 Tax=Umbra pygmaea TaxID=75934 RepID=A0ABD0W090_UMBPY
MVSSGGQGEHSTDWEQLSRKLDLPLYGAWSWVVSGDMLRQIGGYVWRSVGLEYTGIHSTFAGLLGVQKSRGVSCAAQLSVQRSRDASGVVSTESDTALMTWQTCNIGPECLKQAGQADGKTGKAKDRDSSLSCDWRVQKKPKPKEVKHGTATRNRDGTFKSCKREESQRSRINVVRPHETRNLTRIV